MAGVRAGSVRRRPSIAPWACLVAVGGAAGTLARAALEGAFPSAHGAFPWTTFLINIVGSFLLGALQESLVFWGTDEGVRKVIRIGVGTGVIGGFTTYSTFVLESERLFVGPGASPATGVAYVVISVVVGLASAAVGIRSVHAVVHSRRTAGSAARPAPARGEEAS